MQDRVKANEAARRFYWRHREAILLKEKEKRRDPAFCKKNTDRARAWRHKNAERERARRRANRAKNLMRMREYERAYYRKKKQHLFGNYRKYRLKHEYGLSEKDYAAMVELQSGACLICNSTPTLLYVDHDHETGKIRGLLCNTCNVGLGSFKDSPSLLKKAAEYLAQQYCGSTEGA